MVEVLGEKNVGAVAVSDEDKMSISYLGKMAAEIFTEMVNVPETTDGAEMGEIEACVYDPLLYAAGEQLIISKTASASLLQNTLYINFIHAKKIIRELEELHIIIKEENGYHVLVDTIDEWKTVCEAHGIEIKPLVDEKSEVIAGEASKAEIKEQAVSQQELQKKDIDELPVPDIVISDYPEFSAGGVSIWIEDGQIKYKKPIMTKLGMGHVSPCFGGGKITGIIYKKPTLLKKGYFTFTFRDDVKIINHDPNLLSADMGTLSDLIKVEFTFREDAEVFAFLEHVSDNIHLAIIRE